MYPENISKNINIINPIVRTDILKNAAIPIIIKIAIGAKKVALPAKTFINQVSIAKGSIHTILI